MKLLTFDPGDGRPRPGMLAGEAEGTPFVVDLEGALGLAPRPRCLRRLLEEVPLALLFDRLRSLDPSSAGPRLDLASVRLLAPVGRPPKVTALGLNYRGHLAEQRARPGAPPRSRPLDPPKVPLIFAKARTAVCGPSDAIVIAPGQRSVDFEVELCLVVGKPGFRIRREHALEHLLGVTVAIDLSDREAQFADKQWYRGKSYPTFCPTGPVVATLESLDLGCLRLTTRLNGVVMQDGSTTDLIFPVDEVVSYVSSVQPLEVGDLTLTGTPAGVGAFRDPPVFLRPGDRLECAIDGIGALALTVRGEAG